RIWFGARVTLTYILRRGAVGALSRDAAREDLAPRVQEAWRALLADQSFLPKGGTLAYPCCHLYHHDARFQQKQRPGTHDTVTMLKGRDHLVAATALQAGLKVTFNPYMFENCGGLPPEIWSRWNESPTPDRISPGGTHGQATECRANRAAVAGG